MAHIVEALQQINEQAELLFGATVAKGKAFERMVKRSLETHPGEYGPHRFERVWLWDEWPGNGGEPDYGIDLVAQQTERYGGGLCAIQCKFYGENSTVSKAAVDGFIARSEWSDSRLFISTGDLASGAKKTINSANPRCELLGIEQMDGWVDDWREFIDKPEALQVQDLRYEPRPDQEEALRAISWGFAEHDKGKLILPCGTGKSLVALWAAEREVGPGGAVLYLVPSIALMGQTMSAWAQHRAIPHAYLGVCSDYTAGRQKDDPYGGDIAGLAMPVTTDLERVGSAIHEAAQSDDMLVVFSTYQSSPVVADAMANSGLRFDLIICDEAHRTTGLQRTDPALLKHKEALTGFQLVHDDSRLPADKRLFMTATPRVFTERAKQRVLEKSRDVGFDVDSFSMDDESVYGPEFHRMSFSDAIERELLTDYQVLVIAVDEQSLSAELRLRIDTDDDLDKDTAIKLTGCWDALADPGTMGTVRGRSAGQIGESSSNLRAAIAFTNTVKTSKAVADHWWDEVLDAHDQPARPDLLELQVQHIDGSTPAIKRAQQLDLLREAAKNDEGACRVISNARVLTEGVDVPALDAIVFLEPRKSKIDITQAVGRVMRRAEGKDTGYIILPVVVPQGHRVTDEEVLNGSDFKAVWDVIRALRAHDDRVDYWVNNIETAKSKSKVTLRELGGGDDDPGGTENLDPIQGQLALQLDDKVASKIVEMCGSRQYWPTWGQRAAGICLDIEQKLQRALDRPELTVALDDFVETMRTAVGPQVTRESAAEMIAQHLVTIPVFEHMFTDSTFVQQNPVSAAIGDVLRKLEREGVRFDKEREPLARAYEQMRIAFEGAVSAAEKVDILRQIYEGFFDAAMKDTVKRLGIVYTPVPLVDFILRSADAVCRQEFGYGLSSPNVHVLDPFAGTGTFFYRLLTLKGADGEYLIRDEDLLRQYRDELHANEIVLLAYYIAALKIEAGMAERNGFQDQTYEEFSGIVLQDSMLTADRSGQLSGFTPMRENSERAERQTELPIRVIVTNPPWSTGQDDAGDDNPNLRYDHIADRVRATYGAAQLEVTGRAAGGNSAGNLYIQAMRWMSDRLPLGEPGVVAFVHPNSLANATSLVGARKVLREEFDSVYVINLRGYAYPSGEERQNEGDNVFGQGTRNGVQISVFVRHPNASAPLSNNVHYISVPAKMNRSDKCAWLRDLHDVTARRRLESIPITPRHDWIDLSDGTYEQLMPIFGKSGGNSDAAFIDHASGVKTNMDAYVYAFSRHVLVKKIKGLINAYEAAQTELAKASPSELNSVFERLTTNDNLAQIKWTETLKSSLRSGEVITFSQRRIREVLYRPFTKVWLYEDFRILSRGVNVAPMFPKARVAPDSPTESSGIVRPPLDSAPPPDQRVDRRHQPQQSDPVRTPSDRLPRRPLRGRDEPAQSDHSTTTVMEAILITPPPTAPFSALATTSLPDLAAIKGSMQTRTIPRWKRSS